MAKMGMLEMTYKWLLFVGGINWGVIGVAGVNLVEMFLGNFPGLVRVVYSLVGLSALGLGLELITQKK